MLFTDNVTHYTLRITDLLYILQQLMEIDPKYALLTALLSAKWIENHYDSFCLPQQECQLL